MANMPLFRVLYRAAAVRPQVAANDLPPSSGLAPLLSSRGRYSYSRALIRTSSAPLSPGGIGPPNAGNPKRNAII